MDERAGYKGLEMKSDNHEAAHAAESRIDLVHEESISTEEGREAHD